MSNNSVRPAFPVASDHRYNPGMSLRDWFAGQALSSIDPRFSPEVKARIAYETADSMVAYSAQSTYHQ